MESPCRLGVVLLCLASLAHGESSLSSKIRDTIGIGSSSAPKARPGAVLVFINNGTDLESIVAGNMLDRGDLLNVGSDLEQRDPSAVYAHYDGENLVTSQAKLFQGLDNSQGVTTWPALLEKLKAHRDGKSGSYSDLIVFEAYPDGVQAEMVQICDGSYSPSQKCEVISAYLSDSVDQPHSRVRRQAVLSTTAAPTIIVTPAMRANIPLDSVAAFHLLFWTSLAIALTVWGTAYGMWHMDPGRDSIIYRMTSAQKFKKDK